MPSTRQPPLMLEWHAASRVLITFSSAVVRTSSAHWSRMHRHFSSRAPLNTHSYARPFCMSCGVAFAGHTRSRRRVSPKVYRRANGHRTTTRSTVPEHTKDSSLAFSYWYWQSSRWFCSLCWYHDRNLLRSPLPRWPFANWRCTVRRPLPHWSVWCRCVTCNTTHCEASNWTTFCWWAHKRACSSIAHSPLSAAISPCAKTQYSYL